MWTTSLLGLGIQWTSVIILFWHITPVTLRRLITSRPLNICIRGSIDRNVRFASELGGEFDRREVLHDLPTTVHITEWAYTQTESSGGLTWLRKKTTLFLSLANHAVL